MVNRFVNSYMDHPPGEVDHEIHVVVNGPKINPRQETLFNPLKVHFFQHNNVGKDLGGYFAFAEYTDCDLMVCMGTPVHFRRAGWLDYLIQAFLDNGPGLYAPWCFMEPRPHARTTLFAVPPMLLRAYPFVIGDSQRYAAEHGPDSLTLWTRRQGFPVLQVTWKGIFDFDDWHPVENGDSLALDQHCDMVHWT